jgi:hypothetical protein
VKIIVSHDVDHLFWSEHLFRDLYIKTFAARINFWSDKRINRLDELMAYERSMNIPATYFFVMRRGLGVAYHVSKAKPVIEKVSVNGFNVGVHGMAYNDLKTMREEFDEFKKISGLDKFGVRITI